MINRHIGENIRTLREATGFTQSNLAQFVDVDQSLISKIEKGERRITADMLERISALFGMTVDQMESESMPKSELSFAFRGNELDASEMEAIAAINRIMMNSELLSSLLGGQAR